MSADAERAAIALTQSTLDSLPAHVAVVDEHGTLLAVNRAWSVYSAANGGGAGTGVGQNYFTVCGGRDADAQDVVDGLRAVLRGELDTFVKEYPCHGPEQQRWFVLRAAPLVGLGAPRLVLQHQEVTELRVAEESSRIRAGLLDAVDAAVVAVDPDGRVTSWNRGAELLYGWSGEEAVGLTARELLFPEMTPESATRRMSEVRARGRWEGPMELRRKDGSRFPAYVRNATMLGTDDELRGYVGVAVDNTGQLRAERTLRLARDYMHSVTASMAEGLYTLDQDGHVAYVNPAAERLLGWSAAELVGRELHATVHHTRPDGTPFPAEECPLVQARRMNQAVHSDDDVIVRRDGTVIEVEQTQTPFETEDGVGGFVVVIGDITERKREGRDAARRLQDLACIEQIHGALANDRFLLHAQPILEVGSGRTVQHELLIRMRGEDGTMIPPGAFLPVAERYGLIGEIDRWVIGQAVDYAAAGWSVQPNLSAQSISDPTLFGHLDAELQRSGADPAMLTFELTETAVLRNEEAALRFVTAVKQLGCGLALDDFGTGFGGFSYLKRLPVDYLKIDIEFVRDLTTEPASRQVVEAVVSLARGFRIRTVAEGVEDAETLVLLEQLGVDYAQGYHLGRPAPCEDVLNHRKVLQP